MASMREMGSARFLMRNSWSSRVKISFVTAAVVVSHHNIIMNSSKVRGKIERQESATRKQVRKERKDGTRTDVVFLS